MVEVIQTGGGDPVGGVKPLLAGAAFCWPESRNVAAGMHIFSKSESNPWEYSLEKCVDAPLV